MKPDLKEALKIIENLYLEYEEVEGRYFELREKIEWIENNLVELKGTSITTSHASASLETDNKFKGMRTKDAYKKIIREHFEFNAFKEEEIREKSAELGLRVNGKPIIPVTSRSIIRDLRSDGFIETIGRGINRQVKSDAQKEQEALENLPDGRINFPS